MWKSKWLSSCRRSSYQPGVPTIIVNFTSLSFSTLKAKIKKRYHPKSKDKEKIPPENHMCGRRKGSRWSPSSKRSLLSLLYRKSPLLTWRRGTCSLTTNIFNFTWKFSNQPFHRVCDASWTPELKIRRKRCSIWSLLNLSTKIISTNYFSCYVPASRRSRGWVSRASSKSLRPLCSGWLARSLKSTRQGFSEHT